MRTIALTGGIACGKSTVADIFRQFDIPVIDTDVISRELVEPGKPALKEIADTFGEHMLDVDGSLNRTELREIVFKDESKRKQLEAILHPRIRKQVFHQLQNLHSSYAIIVIPLLFETDYPYPIDRVLAVCCDKQTQIKRLLQRPGINQTTAEAMIAAQLPNSKKADLADDVIINDGELSVLTKEVEKLHHKYLVLSDK